MSEPRHIRELIAQWREKVANLHANSDALGLHDQESKMHEIAVAIETQAEELTAWVDSWDKEMSITGDMNYKAANYVQERILGLPDVPAKDAARPTGSPKTALDEQKS